eukprot:m.46162 g.46162  ORF g.46162 m.46162 type:complete len:170 (+) comp10343_c0_seq3:101-610(+)
MDASTTGQAPYEKWILNKMCYFEEHRIPWIVITINSDLMNCLCPCPKHKCMPQTCKHQLLLPLLRMTEYIVFIDIDIAVTKHEVNFWEKYIESDPHFDIGMVDHNKALNNGAFIVRNSKFGRTFALQWLQAAWEQQELRQVKRFKLQISLTNTKYEMYFNYSNPYFSLF